MTPTHAANAIAHVDIFGPEIEALTTFYRDTLGWDIAPKGPGYALVSTPEGGPDGALVEAETPAMVMGVVVDDLDAAVAAAVENGGTLVMPAVDNGWVVKARVADPAGNLLTLIQR